MDRVLDQEELVVVGNLEEFVEIDRIASEMDPDEADGVVSD